MKIPKASLFLLCIPFLQLSLCHSQGKDGSLVAAPYPGSITEPPVEPNSRTFYTKNPIEKVMAHYTKSLGAFEEKSQSSYFREAIPSNDVMDILAKRGIGMGETRMYAGVALFGKQINPNATMAKVMDKLNSAYLMRFSLEVEGVTDITKHIEDPELKQTIARYEHVEWEYFPLAKEKRMDEVIFDKYITGPEDALTKEQQELGKKITELSTAMKYDEAGKVGERMMELMKRQSDPHWNWDNAIKCLQELEKNAYATKIVIDKHPLQWDLSGYK